jgi:predicted Zn-dependent peptidase
MYKLKKTSTGLNLVTIPMAGAKTTAILVIVATGSKHEARNTSGLSHFLEHMFFKGTTNRPNALMISSELDKLGGIYNAFTSKEYTGFWIKSASEQIVPAINVLSDMLLNSKFDQEEIKRESGVITEEVNMYLDNPMMHIEDVFDECLYGDTPAGWSVIGTKANIARFNRADFVKYFKSQYKTSNTFVCLAGKLPNNAEKFLAQAFTGWARGKENKKLVTKEKQTKPTVEIKFKKTDQAHFSLGVRTMPANSKNEATLKVMASLLGGPMSSRLFSNLRERNGLCYYVKTQSEDLSDTGYLTTRAGVTVDKITKAINIVITEYKKLTTELVSEQELKKIKQFISGRIVLSLESPDDIASWYGLQLAVNHQQPKPIRAQTPEEYKAAINKVTAKDLQNLAKKIFTSKNLNLAIIGPYKDKKEFEKLLK